jgi:hypothetical protein
MPNKRKELYCGHCKYIRNEDHTFQWFEAFKWYITLPLEENNSNKVWTSGITLASCMPEVSYFKELIISGALTISTTKRGLFNGRGRCYFSSPTVFRRMLRLPEPTTTFKSSKSDAFLKANHGGTTILDNFLLKFVELL